MFVVGQLYSCYCSLSLSLSNTTPPPPTQLQPLLIDGFKFDLRIYTLVTSVDPLRIFVYNEGLARFATNKYMPPALGNSNNVFMHLTNYCLNRRNSNYNAGHGNEGGSKRKLREYNKWLADHDYSVSEFWAAVDDAIIKTVISAWPVLKHNYHLCFPKHDQIQACFQLLGFDILVDWKLKPYILEVNHTPSLLSDETVDVEVKRPLIRDTLNLLSTPLVDKEEIIREDRMIQRDRLLRQQGRRRVQNQNPNLQSASNSHLSNGRLKQACSISALAQQIAWEESHLGNYRRVMPPTDSEKVNYYCKFYDQVKQPTNMFRHTEASKSRMKVNLEQMQQKTLQEKLEQEKQLQQRYLQERQEKLQKKAFELDAKPTFSSLRRHRCTALVMQDLKRKGMQFFSRDANDKSSNNWNVSTGSKSQLSSAKASYPRLSLKQQMNLAKTRRNRQRRHLRHNARRARCIEWESRADAEFLEKFGMKSTASERLQGGSSQLQIKPSSSKKIQSVKPIRKLLVKTKKMMARKELESSATELMVKPNSVASFPKRRAKTRPKKSTSKSNWLPQPISPEEQQWQQDWRKQRTEDLNHWQLKEMVK